MHFKTIYQLMYVVLPGSNLNYLCYSWSELSLIIMHPLITSKIWSQENYFSLSNIVDLSLLKQVLGFFKYLYPSKRRKPISNSKGKESKQEMCPLKKIARKSSEIYWFLLSSRKYSCPIAFPDIPNCGLISSPYFIWQILLYWTLKNRGYKRAEMK